MARYRMMAVTCFIVMLGLLTFQQAKPTFACTATPKDLRRPTPTPAAHAEVVNQVPVIVEGTITEQSEQEHYIIVAVKRYLKGTGPKMIKIYGFSWVSDCVPHVSRGQSGIIYMNSKGADYDLYPTSMLMQSSTLADDILRIVGQPASAPIPDPSAAKFPTWLYTLIALVLIIGLLRWFMFRRANADQSAPKE